MRGQPSRGRTVKAKSRLDGPAVARTGDIDNAVLALGEARAVRQDLRFVVDTMKELKGSIDKLRDDQSLANAEITRGLRSLMSTMVRVDEHERRLDRLEHINGVNKVADAPKSDRSRR